jgi:hypothetical protein
MKDEPREKKASRTEGSRGHEHEQRGRAEIRGQRAEIRGKRKTSAVCSMARISARAAAIVSSIVGMP